MAERDIVDRLLNGHEDGTIIDADDIVEAAAEIKRLRQELKEAHETEQWLRHHMACGEST